jgi:hypothetical protein
MGGDPQAMVPMSQRLNCGDVRFDRSSGIDHCW